MIMTTPLSLQAVQDASEGAPPLKVHAVKPCADTLQTKHTLFPSKQMLGINPGRFNWS